MNSCELSVRFQRIVKASTDGNVIDCHYVNVTDKTFGIEITNVNLSEFNYSVNIFPLNGAGRGKVENYKTNAMLNTPRSSHSIILSQLSFQHISPD